MQSFLLLSALGIGGTVGSNILRREASWQPSTTAVWTPTSTPAVDAEQTTSSTWQASPTSPATTWWTPSSAAEDFAAAPTSVPTYTPVSSYLPESLWIQWPSSASPAATMLPNPLNNSAQVGNSVLGTFDQRTLPKWIDTPSGDSYTAAPWGNCTPATCDALAPDTIPNTGVTRHYYFSISRAVLSPDGVARDMILINGQFPGPMIQANWGDWVEVTVTNNIQAPEEGTSLHWHGLLQAGTQWQDGVPGVSQCPIAPGETYTYKFRADQFGSSMYHAHYSAQYTAGVYGAMITYGPTQLDYDIDVGPVIVSDWNHIPYFSIVENVMTMNMSEYPTYSDSGLINGRGRFNCSKPSYGQSFNDSNWLASNYPSTLEWSCVDNAQRSQFRFQSGKTHRLRLMNVGADGFQRFSIDGHTMTVIALDYVPVKPYTAESVVLGISQRVDVLITANAASTSSFWMRSELLDAATCGGLAPPGINEFPIFAEVYYEDADTTLEPVSTTTVKNPSCNNAPINITQPEYVIPPSTQPFYQDLVLTLTVNDTGSWEWEINGQTYRADYNNPLLYDAAQGETSFPTDPQYNLYNFASNTSVVLNITNATPFPHPIHMHGHNFYVLNVGGVGAPWDGSVVNADNPLRRDVQIVPPLGFIAIQFEANNPGIWPLHCHVAWHLSGGWYINVMSQPELLTEIPAGQRDMTCKAWDAWTAKNVVDQIDSGS